MATLKFRKKVVLAKNEAVYGTDIVPAGATDAILMRDVSITPMAAETQSRDLIGATLGAQAQSLVGLHVKLDCTVELAGAGAAGDVPGFAPLLRACGFAETINALTNVEYDPVSSAFESASIYFNIDGILHKLLGARGSVAFDFTARKVPVMNFSFVGLWADPTSAALPTAVTSNFQTPLSGSNTNTPTFSVHGFAGVMQSLKLDMKNKVVHRDLINSESVELTDREADGSLLIQTPTLVAKDFFAIAKAETLGAIQLIHGLNAGNIVQIDAPKVQLLAPDYNDSDGIVMSSMNLVVTPDTGDDEIKLTIS